MSRNVFRSARKVALVAATGVLALGGTLLAPAAAHASEPSMRLAPNSNPFLFLGVAGASTSPGAPVIQWSLAGSDQVWTRHMVSPGVFQFVNGNSGQCLFADGIPGDWVYQEPCNAADRHEQFWTNLPGAPGVGYPIESVANPSLYLDIAGAASYQGAHLDQWYWNGGYNQYFTAE